MTLRRAQATPPWRSQSGFSLVELMIVVAIVGLLGSIVVPTYRNAIRSSARAALVADALEFHRAMLQYNADNGQFPTSGTSPQHKLDLTTLAPLSTDGYFPSVASFHAKLHDKRIYVYKSGAGDQEFYAFMRLRQDPAVWVFVANTSSFPVGGNWNGVFLLQGGQFVPVDEGN